MSPPTSESNRQELLLATPRWSWLREFTARWYAEPLSAADGSPPDEVAAARERVGGDLPTVLVEWFELVGRRIPETDWLVPPQPRTLRRSDGVPGAIEVWGDIQSSWEFTAPFGGDDPEASSEFFEVRAPLSRVLQG